LDVAVFADRITVNSVTGYSPYYLLHGIHPLLPFDLSEATFLVDGFRSGLSTAELLTLRIRQSTRHQEDIERAAHTLRSARFKSKQQFEQRYRKRLRKERYAPGEMVLVRNTRLESSVARLKTEPRYFGPYVVVERTRGGAYILEEVDGATHAEHYAAFRLLPYILRNDPVLHTLVEEDQPPPPDEEHTDIDLPDDSDHQSDVTSSGSDTN
jgi:ribosomal protein L21E